MKSKHRLKYQWLLLGDRPARIQLRSVTSGSIVCYPITATSRFWMCQAFLSFLPLPPTPSKISSPLAPQEGLILRLPLRRGSTAGRLSLNLYSLLQSKLEALNGAYVCVIELNQVKYSRFSLSRNQK